MQVRLVGLKPAPRPSFRCSDLVPPCTKATHALICLYNPTSSSQVSLQHRNRDCFPPAPATPQLIPYAEKQPSSLTVPQPLAPMLSPFTCLYTSNPMHHVPGAFAFGAPACMGIIFSLHPQSRILLVCASKIKWIGVCRIQSTDRWRWLAKVFKSTSNPI